MIFPLAATDAVCDWADISDYDSSDRSPFLDSVCLDGVCCSGLASSRGPDDGPEGTRRGY
jgi:hypothetical protein